jgi:hypothetical protein
LPAKFKEQFQNYRKGGDGGRCKALALQPEHPNFLADFCSQ